MELKPCPWCGDTKFLHASQEFKGSKWGWIECGWCGARGPDVRTGYQDMEMWFDEAAVEWNRREGKKHENRTT